MSSTKVKIEAGRELDKAVAESIGQSEDHHWEHHGDALAVSMYRCKKCGGTVVCRCNSRPRHDVCLPWYSTDLNAAFAAADVAEVFELHTLTQREDGLWRLVDSNDWFENVPGIATTPALAICAAILKLKEVT